MAYSHFALLDQNSSGATRNAGQNGDLTALLDWALTSNSNWTSVYNDGGSPVKKRIWAPSGGGIVLMCNHDSAVSGQQYFATMRLAESQSGGTLTDPIPLALQVADTLSVWQNSNVANTTNQQFRILVCEDGIHFFSRYSNTVSQWAWFFAFKCKSRYSPDNYSWVIGVANSASSGQDCNKVLGNPSPYAQADKKCYAMRNVLGTIKSEILVPDFPFAGYTSGQFPTGNLMPAATVNPDGAFERRKFLLSAVGSNSATQGPLPSLDRLAIPHVWYLPVSSLTGFSETDTFTDANGSTYELYRSASNGGGILLQTSNDWSGYPAG